MPARYGVLARSCAQHTSFAASLYRLAYDALDGAPVTTAIG
jgi:hypothetical protein